MRERFDHLELFRQFEYRKALPTKELFQLVERHAFAGFGNYDRANPFSHDFIVIADNGDFGHAGVSGQNIVHLVGRNIHAASHDDVLAPPDEFVKSRLVIVARDLKHIARLEIAVFREYFLVRFRRLVVTVEDARAPDLEFTLLAGIGHLITALKISEPGSNSLADTIAPFKTLDPESREILGAVSRIRQVLCTGAKTCTLVGSKYIQNTDAILVLKSSYHPF